jgi:hypothetical protein
MKQKKELVSLAVLLVVLAYVGWYLLRSSEQVSQGPSALNYNYAPLGVESPAPHEWKIADARKTEYTKTLRNIFSPNAPPPVDPDAKKGPSAVAPRPYGPEKPAPPVPPNLPVTYFGYGTIPNGTARRAFLTNHEDIYIVGEGDTLLGRFRILKINNASIDFEEISTGLRNSSPLVIEEAGAGTPPAPPPAPVS